MEGEETDPVGAEIMGSLIGRMFRSVTLTLRSEDIRISYFWNDIGGITVSDSSVDLHALPKADQDELNRQFRKHIGFDDRTNASTEVRSD
jgi:hypothetical protein